MRIFLAVFVLFFSSAVLSIEWDFETLTPVFEGCLQNSSNGSDYEYCGCYVNGLSKQFSVLEVVQLVDSGKLESNEEDEYVDKYWSFNLFAWN